MLVLRYVVACNFELQLFNCFLKTTIIGLEQIVKDIRFMLSFGLGIYWKLTWCIFIPIALAVIFIYAMV